MKRSLLAAALTLFFSLPLLAHVQAQPPLPPESDPNGPLPTPPKPEYKPEYPAAPVDGIYVSDRGVVLTVQEQKDVNKAAAKVKFTSGLPVYVVTISSLERMGADPALGLDPYARELFKHWSVASAKEDRGVLMVLSRDDRQARVLLGAGWPAVQQVTAKAAADEILLPALKTGRVGDSVLAAINHIDAMFVAAGYSSEMPAGAAGAAGGKLAPVQQPAAAPPPPSFVNAMGVGAWVAIVVVGAVLVVVAVLAVLATKRSSAPPG